MKIRRYKPFNADIVHFSGSGVSTRFQMRLVKHTESEMSLLTHQSKDIHTEFQMRKFTLRTQNTILREPSGIYGS